MGWNNANSCRTLYVIAKQHSQNSLIMMSGDEIRFVVSVEITYGCKPWLTCAQRDITSSKAALSISKQQRQRATRRQLLRSRRTGSGSV